MKKRMKKSSKKIILSNRWLYTLIAIGILAILGVGVYAFGTSNPTVFGHSAGELDGVCKTDGTGCPTLMTWTTSGNNIYNSNTGNVGIGTTAPTQKLDITGNLKVSNNILTNSLTLGEGVNPGDKGIFAENRIITHGIVITGSVKAVRSINSSTMKTGEMAVETMVKFTGTSVSLASSCTSSQFGEIRGCYSSSNYHPVCMCIRYGSSSYRWERLYTSSSN